MGRAILHHEDSTRRVRGARFRDVIRLLLPLLLLSAILLIPLTYLYWRAMGFLQCPPGCKPGRRGLAREHGPSVFRPPTSAITMRLHFHVRR
jgi:hypothetical protein